MRITPVTPYRTMHPKKQEGKTPSFSGYSYNVRKTTKDGRGDYQIIETNISDLTDRPWMYGTFRELTELYNEKVDPYRKFEPGRADNYLMYVADPEEPITDKIRNEHFYIAIDTEPPIPSLEQLEEKFKSKNPVPYDYLRDVNLNMHYNGRKHNPGLDKVKKAEDYIKYYEQLEKSYDQVTNCRPSDVIKKYLLYMEAKQTLKNSPKVSSDNKGDFVFANHLRGLLGRSNEDLKKRDELAKQILFIDENLPIAEKRLKEIEVEKYLLDERTEYIRQDYERACKQEDEERRRCGPSYNSSYPPSQTYYRLMSDLNHIRDNTEKSAELQKQYDMYLDLKNNGIGKKQNAQEQLDRLHEKLAHVFDEIKQLYANHKKI